ncbi:MAG TPA: PAS domain-containing protein, partial [Bacteroidales bacterium]|nr:PAS domain-containing protein [Bacteroidales bacterium]
MKSHFLEHIIFSLFVSGVIYILLSKDYFVRNKFQAIIREEELKYQILFKNANDAILLIKDHYIIDCNLKSCEIFNCEKEYLVGKSLLNFSSESKNAERLLEYIKLSSSKPQHFEWKYSRNEEKSFDAEVTLNQVDMSGTLFIQVFIKDVTELRKSQRAFTDSEGKFKSIFNSVNDGIIIFTNNHRVLEVNDVVLRRYHLTKEEFIQLPPDNKFSKAIVSSINHYLPELELHDEILFEVEEVVTPEKTLLLEMRLRKLNYGGEAAYIVVGRDISQRKYNQMSQYNAVIQAEEQERSRVAKELHDGISPVLSTAKLYVQSIEDCKSDELKERVMSKIESTIEESIVGISEISNKLSPHILQNFGITAA